MTAGDTQRAPGVLLDYQKAWVADDSQVKVCEKSRRIGISWTEAADATLYAAQSGKGNVYYQSYAKDMTRQFIDDCAEWAKFYNLAASKVEEVVLKDEDKDIQAYQIRFDSGRMIQALSSSPRQLRSKGKPGDLVILDEFAFVDDQAELMKAAMAFIIWGGRVRIISTHNGEDNPFNTLVEDVRSGKKPFSLHSIDFDKAIRDGLYERINLRTGQDYSPEKEAEWRQKIVEFYGEDAEEELYLIPSKGDGVYFTRPMIKSAMKHGIPIVKWERPTSWEELPDDIRTTECLLWCVENLSPLLDSLPDKAHWFGEDFARNQNLTVIWPIHQKPDSNLRVPFAVELINIPFRQQEQVLFYVLDRLPRFSGGAMDARGNGQALAEYAMQRYGADRIHRIMLTQQFYMAHFPVYKSTVTDGAIDLPESEEVVDDHRAVKRVKGVPMITEVQAKTGKIRRHGDSAVAGLMAVYAVNEIAPYAPIEVSVGPQRQAQTLTRGYAL